MKTSVGSSAYLCTQNIRPNLYEENICLCLDDNDALDGIGEHVGTGTPTH